MRSMLDERIEYAVKQLWANPWNNEGRYAKKLLEKAAKEGNGDAYFFLGRCYLGGCFVSERFGFEEDEEKGMECFQRSIELGSAVGMFGSMRLSGFKPRTGSFVSKPYNSLKEIWDVVFELAQNGELFCKYMIANALYYGDCIKMLGIPESEVNMQLIRGFQYQAIAIYEECTENQMTFCIGNLIDIYSSGDYGMQKNPKRVQELTAIRRSHERAHDLLDKAFALGKTDPEQALQIYQEYLKHEEYGAYFGMGLLFTFGGKMQQDLAKAKEYFEKGLEKEARVLDCKIELGKIYYYGGDGVSQDYEKAFVLFREAKMESDIVAPMLGTCYLKGYGTKIDYEKAMAEFLLCEDEPMADIGLGEMYCFGLGVKKKYCKGHEIF